MNQIETKENEILDLLLKKPELILDMPLEKLQTILKLLETKNDENEDKIKKLEKKVKK